MFRFLGGPSFFPASVFLKVHIKHPTRSVPCSPTPPNILPESFLRRILIADKVPDTNTRFIPRRTARPAFYDARKALPFLLPAQKPRIRGRPYPPPPGFTRLPKPVLRALLQSPGIQPFKYPAKRGSVRYALGKFKKLSEPRSRPVSSLSPKPPLRVIIGHSPMTNRPVNLCRIQAPLPPRIRYLPKILFHPP
jgi:hypothetical protein